MQRDIHDSFDFKKKMYSKQMLNLSNKELYIFMNEVLSQSYRRRPIVMDVQDTVRTNPNLSPTSKELLNDPNMPKSIIQFFATYKPYDEMHKKFEDMTKLTMGSPCYGVYKKKIDIVEFYLRMIKYLQQSNILHKIGQVVFMHSSTTKENMWKVPDFTDFDNENMHVPLKSVPQVTKLFISLYNKIVKDVINGKSDELRYIANTLGGPHIQTFSNCAGPHFEKSTPESRRDNCSLFSHDIMCVCHGHQPNALAMMIREKENKCRLSLDTRFSGLSIGIGYIGDAIKVQPTELINEFCGSLEEAKTEFEHILQKPASARAVIGPVVGKTKEEKVVRLVFFKDGFTQAVILVCDERLTDDKIKSETYYNTIGHFYGDIKKKEKGVFTSIDAGRSNVCNKTLIEGEFTRPNTLLKFGFDPKSKVIKPKIEPKENNKMSITYAFSTRDKFCGQIYDCNSSSFEVVNFVDKNEKQSIVIGTDCEGFVQDLALLNEAAKFLKPKHKSIDVVFCGDVVDHGKHNFECLKYIEKMRKSNKYKFTSIIGNRDINKLRLMEILKGENVTWWNYMTDEKYKYTSKTTYEYPGIKDWKTYAERYSR